jgi:hypothetical protein
MAMGGTVIRFAFGMGSIFLLSSYKLIHRIIDCIAEGMSLETVFKGDGRRDSVLPSVQ